MASSFLELPRNDEAACHRAFERIASETATPASPSAARSIPNAELPRFFRYIGAVTAPEALDHILEQFSTVGEISLEDAMGLYAIWLRMVSTNDPPALAVLQKRKIVKDDAAQEAHWVDRLSAYLGNTTIMWLTLGRQIFINVITMVHWFSVFFRDADAALRCGPVGIGFDVALTVIMGLDLFIEYYAQDYRTEIKRVLEEKQMQISRQRQQERQREQHQQQQQQQHMQQNPLSVSSFRQQQQQQPPQHQPQQQDAVGGGIEAYGGSFSGIQQFNSSSPTQQQQLPQSPSNNQLLEEQQRRRRQSSIVGSPSTTPDLTALDTFAAFMYCFCTRPKNILALIALIPIDLFLCAGGAVTAATVLNNLRLVAVFRNFIDANPPPANPLTAAFADIYYLWMPLWTMTYTFVTVCSIFAIIFVILRNTNSLPEATRLDFLTAFYLVVQTFTTVGYGDVALHGTSEFWFAVVLVLIGMITNATVIGSLVAIIQLGNANLVRGDKIRETHAVLHYFSIPRLLQLEILGFQEHVLFSDVISAFHDDVDPFPPAMKDAMILQHRLDVLRQIHPLSDCSPEELFFFAKEFTSTCFKPEEYLSCCTEPHHGVRVLLFGLVDRLDSRGHYITTLRSGDSFGLEGIMTGRDEQFNHKALSYCDLLVISYDDFHNVLDTLPKLAGWMRPALFKMEREAEQEEARKRASENGGDAGGAGGGGPGDENNNTNDASSSGHFEAKVLRSPVSMIDTNGTTNLSMIHDMRSELRVLRRGLQSLAMSPAMSSIGKV